MKFTLVASLVVATVALGCAKKNNLNSGVVTPEGQCPDHVVQLHMNAPYVTQRLESAVQLLNSRSTNLTDCEQKCKSFDLSLPADRQQYKVRVQAGVQEYLNLCPQIMRSEFVCEYALHERGDDHIREVSSEELAEFCNSASEMLGALTDA